LDMSILILRVLTSWTIGIAGICFALLRNPILVGLYGKV
jgi:hypothetical protein